MISGSKKTRRKKEAKREASKEPPPQVVTRSLADNTYCGIIREGHFGEQYLECADAKYTWPSGITYEGPFVATRIEGKGKYSWPDGSSYEGELLNGKRHGQGVYVSPDGTTRYEGGWLVGKRSGKGKLTYNSEGTSYFEGCWKDGKKHGYGRQLWPSGNIYEGEWEEGKMSGQGRMLWRTAGGSEEYSGAWQDNEPHGSGTHTWHSTDITIAPAAADTAPGDTPLQRRPVPYNPQQQQLNNRYEGEFVHGKRHGYGAFFYANGAYYRGEWKDHMKHGQGRHTFEDGTVYDGSFEEDRMLDYVKPPPVEGADSIARCMDLSDIDGLALPGDRSGFEASAGAGYTDHGKIFREIYNMLLRHLGELREYYAKYRAMTPVQSADPFSLKTYQFWAFARDTGLLTPSCSLARFDRFVFSGPRHQSEVSPEDLPDIRPFRQADFGDRRASRLGQTGTSGGVGSAPGSPTGRASVRSQPDAASLPDAEDEASSFGSGSEASSPSSAARRSSAAASPTARSAGESMPTSPSNAIDQPADSESPEGATPGETAEPTEPEEAEPQSATTTASASLAVALGARFDRAEGVAPIVDNHEPTRQLLLRQFLEGIVRLAHVRYPNERGYEAQIQRIFRENLTPGYEPQAASEHIFAFLVDRELQSVIQAFSSELWGIFECPGPDARPRGDRDRAGALAAGIGRVRRDLHVKARRDVTLRIKDLLRLLDACGLLVQQPPAAEAPAAADGEDAGIDDGEGSADEMASGGSSAEKDVANFLDDARGINGRSGAPSADAPGLGLLQGGPDAFSDLGGVALPKISRKKGKDGQQQGAEEAKEPALVDVLKRCDFAMTPLEVFRTLAETLAPRCLHGICYEIGGLGLGPPEKSPPAFASEEPTERVQWMSLPTDEQFPMLEYVETDLVYAEFLRLLLQMMERGMRPFPATVERTALPRRFHAFLQHVLLPALAARREPPQPEPQELAAATQQRPPSLRDEVGTNDVGDEAEGETEAPSAGDGADVPADGGASAQGEVGDAAVAGDAAGAGEVSQSPAEQLELWPGFEGPAVEPRKAGAAAAAAAIASRGMRRWPVGYEDEVLEW